MVFKIEEFLGKLFNCVVDDKRCNLKPAKFILQFFSLLLEHILSIRCGNLTDLAMESMTGLINVSINVKRLAEIVS